MIPFVEVSHLASSTSFYSGILQPLGLLYTPPPEVRGQPSSLPKSVAYRVNGGDPVLELRQTENPLKPPVLTSLVISAPSQQSVALFHRCGARSDPPLWSMFRDRRGLEKHFKDVEAARQGPWQTTDRSRAQHTHAVLYDLDGNRIEVVYSQEYGNEGPPPGVLDWKFDVEGASQAAPKATRITLNARKVSGGNPIGESHRSTALTHTRHTEATYGPPAGYRSAHPGAISKAPAPTVAETMSSQRREPQQQSGVNPTTVMGALLGVAAAGALTYGIVQSVREPSPDGPEQRYIPDGPPRRRATFPDKPVTSYRRQSIHETGVVPMYNYHDHKTPRKFAYPDFNSLPIRNAYVEGDEDVEYGKDPWSSSPQYLTRPPVQNIYPRSRGTSRTRVIEEIQETRSRHSTRPHGHAPSIRARSEAGRPQVENYERAYYPPSHRTVAPESTAPPRANGLKVRRPPVQSEMERETYVSARTHRSSRVDPQPDRGRTDDEPRSRSRVRSRARSRPRSRTRSRARTHVSAVTARPPPVRTAYSTAPTRASARRMPLPQSGAGSSQAGWEARDIPLPMSGVGSSHADWDDDMESLAPSDSISCVGSRPTSNRRVRKHHH